MDDTAWSLGGSQDWSLGAPPAYKSRPELRAPARPAISPLAPPPASVPSLTAATAAPTGPSPREPGASARAGTLLAPPPQMAPPPPQVDPAEQWGKYLPSHAPTKKKQQQKKKEKAALRRVARLDQLAEDRRRNDSSAGVTPAPMRFVQARQDGEVRQDGDVIKAEGSDGTLYVLENSPHTFVVDDVVALPEAIKTIQKAGFEPIYERSGPDEWEVRFVRRPGGTP